ncbi:MAG: U32 family peptidase [Spirochaetia bacterium]|nr:U32 family peptidase [Spirochaetia bacterium]
MGDYITEIMAPVGNKAMLEAAIHNGADSVYLGMPGFNARGRADDLSLVELAEFIDTAHIYGVKVYVAFNILVFDDEITEAFNLFLKINHLGPDAWIIQDAGLALLIKTIAPDVHLHASTQMTIVNNLDILFYSNLNFKRYTLARELSLKEIEQINKQSQVELEVFIHGSLCIAYSGQCFTSSGFGGRSANRGECAQSCRHDYELFADNKKIHTGGNYLVSPRDLIGAEQAKKLSEAGIHALKIEGRLKSPEYVAAAVELYRSIIDLKTKNTSHLISANQLTFNRDAKAGWLEGVDNKELVNAHINSHTGVYLGKVQDIKPGRYITIELPSKLPIEINKGDGIVVACNQDSYGSHVYNVNVLDKSKATLIQLSLANDFSYFKIKPSMPVYLTSSSRVQRELTKSFTDKNRLKHIPVEISLTGIIGEKLRLSLHDYQQNSNLKFAHEIIIYSEFPLEKSQKYPADVELIKNELSALSGSPYTAKNIQLNIDPDGFYPNRVIKELRQQAIEQLTKARIHREINQKNSLQIDENYLAKIIQNTFNKQIPVQNNHSTTHECRLHVLVRNPDQLNAVLNLDKSIIHTVYLDFTYGYEFADAVTKIKNNNLHAGIATARIYKPGEEKQLNLLVSLKPDFILARNVTSMQYLKGLQNNIALIGDFSLNITNQMSSQYFLQKGLQRITASYDLVSDHGREQNIDKIFTFLKSTPPNLVEVNMSYYLPSFYMEYCLFTKHLGNGLDSPGCGFPCKDHDVVLKDRKGEVHPVIADRNCRNTMFNGKQKNLMGQMNKHMTGLLKVGIKNFRVELSPDKQQLQNDLEMVSKIYQCF